MMRTAYNLTKEFVSIYILAEKYQLNTSAFTIRKLRDVTWLWRTLTAFFTMSQGIYTNISDSDPLFRKDFVKKGPRVSKLWETPAPMISVERRPCSRENRCFDISRDRTCYYQQAESWDDSKSKVLQLKMKKTPGASHSIPSINVEDIIQLRPDMHSTSQTSEQAH